MSLYGHGRETSPNLDRRSETAVVFERAIAQWPKTGTSFASIFSGRYPQSTGLTHKAALRIPEDLATLPRILQRQGFTTAAVVSNPVLSPDLGWNRGFELYLTTWSEEMTSDPHQYRPMLNAPRVNELALPLISELTTQKSPKERLFLWLHYSDPHAPYILPSSVENPFLGDAIQVAQESGGSERVDLSGTKGREIPGHDELPYYLAQYDANIWLSDQYIEKALQALEEAGILSDALVIFTSDHGESLGEHNLYFEHGPLPYNPGISVPLVVWSPEFTSEQQGRRVTRTVELIDVLPTLLESLLPAARAEMDGQSLQPHFAPRKALAEASEGEDLAFSESGRSPRHDRSVQSPDWKLIWRSPGRQRRAKGGQPKPGRYELYDLRNDPQETRDLVALGAAPPEIFQDLEQKLVAWRSQARNRVEGEPEVSDAVKKALEALGYVE